MLAQSHERAGTTDTRPHNHLDAEADANKLKTLARRVCAADEAPSAASATP